VLAGPTTPTRAGPAPRSRRPAATRPPPQQRARTTDWPCPLPHPSVRRPVAPVSDASHMTETRRKTPAL
jgi:hypothetical protein